MAADAAGAIPAGLTDRAVQVVRAGLAAAIAVASDQGLPTAGPRVLSCRGNLIVHLVPAPVVARVATLTGWTRADPYRWLAREVAVAGHLAKRGGPVVAPASRADPGPHRSHGLAVSLWDYVPPSEQRPRPEETGEALAQLHLAAADFPGQLPDMSPARELISEGLAALEREHVITQQELAALQGRHSSVLVELATGNRSAGVLHGDAHPRNLIKIGADWGWIDLEESCRGPLNWDLAVLTCYSRGGQRALAAYGAATGMPTPDRQDLAPFTRARELEVTVWMLAMAHMYPARYRGQAQRRMAALVCS